MKRPGLAWLLLAALLGIGASVAWQLPAARADWQPQLAWTQPWRWWIAAFVHWSPMHLGANLLGLLVVGALGLAARLPATMALAWLMAWPFTQMGLVLRPDLAHFGGLSGVLHAGVAVAALHMVVREKGPRSGIGAAVAVGLILKVVLEKPWGPVLQHPPQWDIAVVPWSHACGVVAGALCATLALLAWDEREPAD